MRKTKIMVVDDEHLIRWSLEQNLKKQGYEVCTAGTGEDALRLAREEQPELVLLDYHLPGINGLDTSSGPECDTRARQRSARSGLRARTGPWR